MSAPARCLGCGHSKLHRHGFYGRDVIEGGRPWRIIIPRFLCVRCFRTSSCLPSFALPYRLLATATIQAFLQGRSSLPGNAREGHRLRSCHRRWRQRALAIEKIIGSYYAPASEEPAELRLLKGIMDQAGDLERGAIQLLETFGETPLGFYCIHDWARVPRGSVDPLRKAPRLDSS